MDIGKKALQEEGVIFSFDGIISQEMLSNIAETMQERMINYGMPTKVIHNIFGIFVEQMQNILSYSKNKIALDKTRFESFGLAVIGYDKNKQKYYACSRNLIDVSVAETLKNKLNKLNSLSAEEIKEYYKESRKSGQNKHSRGAGLGFLEMLKKSSEPLEYEIKTVDEESAFFSLKAYI